MSYLDTDNPEIADWLHRIRRDALPSYVAVEGPIGVGKTTLTKMLAETF